MNVSFVRHGPSAVSYNHLCDVQGWTPAFFPGLVLRPSRVGSGSRGAACLAAGLVLFFGGAAFSSSVTTDSWPRLLAFGAVPVAFCGRPRARAGGWSLTGLLASLYYDFGLTVGRRFAWTPGLPPGLWCLVRDPGLQGFGFGRHGRRDERELVLRECCLLSSTFEFS